MTQYSVELEAAGPLAMFARPDTGGTPTSYPVPTWSAAKGIFESIAFLEDGAAWINPVAVEICRRRGQTGGVIRYQRYTTNYGGPLRESQLRTGVLPGGNNMQFFATVVRDACYRLYGTVVASNYKPAFNARHYLKALFDRRLVKQGRCFRTPCLGWSEFTCSYWGPFRRGQTEVDDAISLPIPSMVRSIWDRAARGIAYAPCFEQNLEIKNGRLDYRTGPDGVEN